MAASDTRTLPDVGEVLLPVLARVPREHQPLLIALAERLAAERYRGWAGLSEHQAHRDRLLACAEREEEIARRIEGLFPDAESIQRDLLGRNPDLEEVNRTLFLDHPVPDQLTIQARGERLGAATWRSFAKEASEEHAAVLRSCARLEEESAEVLESILGLRRPSGA